MLRDLSFALLVLVSACASTDDKKKAQNYFELGLSLLEDERYPECITQLENAARLDPSRNDIPMHTGLCHMKLENYPKAESLIREACEAEKNFSDCWNNLSYLYLKTKKWGEAQKAAEKALSNSTYKTPDIALSNLAIAKIELRQIPQAKKDLEKAIRMNAANCTPPLLLGKISIEQKEFEEALRYILSARELCAMNALTHLWEAFAYYKLGQRENAKEKYREVLRIFKRGEAVEYSRLNLEKMRKKNPLEEPPLL